MNDQDSYWRPAPPLLLGAGLLLWGWQNGFPVYALLMALACHRQGVQQSYGPFRPGIFYYCSLYIYRQGRGWYLYDPVNHPICAVPAYPGPALQ